MPTFITAEEVAQQLRMSSTNSLASSKAILARYRKNGLPYYKFGATKVSRILYTQEDLDKWVGSQHVTG